MTCHVSSVTCFCPERDQILVTASTVAGRPEQARGGGGEVGGCGELKVFIHLLIILSCHPTHCCCQLTLWLSTAGFPGTWVQTVSTPSAPRLASRVPALSNWDIAILQTGQGVPLMQYLHKI